MEKREFYRTLPLIPLREMVVFPGTLVAFLVGRPTSVNALEKALSINKRVFLATQIDPSVDLPDTKDIYSIGVEARIIEAVTAKHPGASRGKGYKVVVEGLKRARIVEFERFYPHYEVLIKDLPEIEVKKEEIGPHFDKLLKLFKKYMSQPGKEHPKKSLPSPGTASPEAVSDLVASHLELPVTEKQNILEIVNPIERIKYLIFLLEKELSYQSKKRSTKKRGMRFPQHFPPPPFEEGEIEDLPSDIEELREQILNANMPENVRNIALKEVKRLETMYPSSAEATVSRTYIEWLLSLPWKKKSRENKDIKRAKRILEEDHYGLEKVKERILEFLVVRARSKKLKSPILCFVGPPGVGKSSLAKSIARATGRKFVRFSLGGVRDEAEIKGHRRTYIGAYPGQIIKQIKKAGVKNPVFLLDEVDKMTADFRGDPFSALLEALDPEQNKEFVDHYIDVEFDLSDVFFITTANTTHTIPRALLDRMEVIEISGYTENEKLHIAKKYLVKKEIKANGLKENEIEFTDSSILLLIRKYTRESGVRNLQRIIGKICRKAVVEIEEKGIKKVVVDEKKVEEYLGAHKYKSLKKLQFDTIGASTGLGWTEYGGDILIFETTLVPGKGNLVLTGSLGDVMKESANTAYSYVKSKLFEMGFDFSELNQYDIHLHVPEGAIPKDGPSAGITIATAIISLFTGTPVRNDIAMTGEISLQGRVLPVGGLKEKLISALREGISEVILPEENYADVEEIPQDIRGKLKIHYVSKAEEVFEIALRGGFKNLKKKSFMLSVEKEKVQ